MRKHRFKKWLVDYIEGTLPEKKKRWMEDFLRTDPHLAEETNKYLQLKNLASKHHLPGFSEQFWEEYVPKLRMKLAQEQSTIPKWHLVPVPFLATVILIIISIFTVTYFYSPYPYEKSLLTQVSPLENLEIEDYIVENYKIEEIIESTFPKIITYFLTGGDYYETFQNFLIYH